MANFLIYSIVANAVFGAVLLEEHNIQSQSINGNSKYECNATITTQYGVIRSPGYPDRYPRYSRCQYVVKKFSPDVCELKLTMETFDVAKMAFSNCSEDFFEVMNRAKSYRLCGELPPGSKKFVFFPPNSSSLVFRFQSTFHQNKGFSIQVKQLPYSCPRNGNLPAMALQAAMPTAPTCAQHIKGRIDRITFPDEDGVDIRKCVYTIQRSEPRACVVQLDFSSFEVTYAAGCASDHLLLPTGQKLCGVLGGTRKSLEFPPGKDTMKLEFFTSSRNSNTFDIQVAQLPGPCDYGSTSSTTGTIDNGSDVNTTEQETTTAFVVLMESNGTDFINNSTS